jgi:hypothetical protein
VERAVQRPPVAVKEIPSLLGNAGVDVDGLEPALWREG